MTSYIFLSPNQKTLVDKILYDYLNQWLWYYNGYYAYRNDNTISYMHTKIFQLYHPSYAGKVDHENRIKLDNRYENLRPATDVQSASNKSKPINNTSGFKGVVWDKERHKWLVSIGVNNKLIFLGRYEDILEAAKAYDRAAIYYHGEFACLNMLEYMSDYLSSPYINTVKINCKGENNNQASITEKDVLYILTEFHKGKSQKQLVIETGLSIAQINKIINRKVWKHIKYNPYEQLLPGEP